MTNIEGVMDRIKLAGAAVIAAAVGVGLALRRERQIEEGARRLNELHARYSDAGAIRAAMDDRGDVPAVVGSFRLLEDVAGIGGIYSAGARP